METRRPASYDTVAQLLHWVMAGGLFWLILFSEFETATDAQMTERIKLHAGVGLLIGTLGLIRLVWRLRRPHPALPSDGSAWQNRLAGTVVWTLYGLFLLSPIVGLILAGLVSYPVSPFGIYDLSNWLGDQESAASLINSVHGFMADLMLVLIALHIGAALYHHFVKKDGLIWRMLPGRR